MNSRCELYLLIIVLTTFSWSCGPAANVQTDLPHDSAIDSALKKGMTRQQAHNALQVPLSDPGAYSYWFSGTTAQDELCRSPLLQGKVVQLLYMNQTSGPILVGWKILDDVWPKPFVNVLSPAQRANKRGDQTGGDQ